MNLLLKDATQAIDMHVHIIGTSINSAYIDHAHAAHT